MKKKFYRVEFFDNESRVWFSELDRLDSLSGARKYVSHCDKVYKHRIVRVEITEKVVK